jgi:hypothetical protein
MAAYGAHSRVVTQTLMKASCHAAGRVCRPVAWRDPIVRADVRALRSSLTTSSIVTRLRGPAASVTEPPSPCFRSSLTDPNHQGPSCSPPWCFLPTGSSWSACRERLARAQDDGYVSRRSQMHVVAGDQVGIRSRLWGHPASVNRLTKFRPSVKLVAVFECVFP